MLFAHKGSFRPGIQVIIPRTVNEKLRELAVYFTLDDLHSQRPAVFPKNQDSSSHSTRHGTNVASLACARSPGLTDHP
jgi:hypothetical protein